MTIVARITSEPSRSGTVLVDFLEQPLGIRREDPIDLGTPDVSFDSQGMPVDGSRTVTVPLHIQGDGSTVGVAMQRVARAISVPDRWLMIQRNEASEPAWYRITPASPGSLSIRHAFDRRDGWWSWALQLTVDSTSVGERRVVPMEDTEDPVTAVTNTGTDRGLVIDSPGEAPSRLRVDATPSQAMTGRRVMVSTFSVPWGSPLLNGSRPALIREDSDFASIVGHSTRTTGHASLSGGTGITITLDTTSNRQVAATSAGSTWRPEPGRYLVMARLFREGGEAEIKIRMGQSWGSVTSLQGWRTWRPVGAGTRASWMPVGYLQHPMGDHGRGLDPATIMPPMIRFDVTPTVTDPTALLHLDQVAFVPVELARGAGVRACFAQFEPGIGFGDGLTLRVDGEGERVSIMDAFGHTHATPQPLRTGGWPMAVPGMATCVSIFLDTSDRPVGLDSVAVTSQVSVSTSPRLLHLGTE